MTEPDNSPPALFAALTELFEDAAGIAADGQAEDLPDNTIRTLKDRLTKHYRRAGQLLNRLDC